MIWISGILLIVLILLGCEISLGRENFKFIIFSVDRSSNRFTIVFFGIENNQTTYSLFDLSLGKNINIINVLFFIRTVW